MRRARYTGTMKGHSRARSWHEYVYSWPAIIVVWVGVILLAVSAYGMYKRDIRSRTGLERSIERYDELEGRRVELEKRSSVASTVGVEEEIRSRFSLVKPGERMLILTGEYATNTPVAEKRSLTIFEKIFQLFGM